ELHAARCLELHPWIYVRWILPIARDDCVPPLEWECARREVEAIRCVHHERDLARFRTDETRAPHPRVRQLAELHLRGVSPRLRAKRRELLDPLNGSLRQRTGGSVVQKDLIAGDGPWELSGAQLANGVGHGSTSGVGTPAMGAAVSMRRG